MRERESSPSVRVRMDRGCSGACDIVFGVGRAHGLSAHASRKLDDRGPFPERLKSESEPRDQFSSATFT